MSSNNNDNNNATTMMLEVEQKFAITDIASVQERLIEAGFTTDVTCRKTIFDWYFDVPAANYPLLRQDCWLRYRSSTSTSGNNNDDGQWELKRGTTNITANKESKATVYQEIEGPQALLQARELIQSYLQQQQSQPPDNPNHHDNKYRNPLLFIDGHVSITDMRTTRANSDFLWKSKKP